MKTIKDLLIEHRFFDGMTYEMVELISGCGKNVHFQPNEYMFKSGDSADTFYVLRTGKVAVEINHPPQGVLILETMGEDDVLGFSWILPPYRYFFDARCLESTSAVAIDGKCIREKCENDHDVGYEVMKRFAGLMGKMLTNARLQLLDIYGSKN